MSKKSSTFALAFEKKHLPGAVVQLVRIPACHAVGREFESRPHRKPAILRALLLLHIEKIVRKLRNQPKICSNCHLIRNTRRISFCSSVIR